MLIRESSQADLSSIIAVESAAFSSTEEAELAKNLISDPSAEPTLSLLAFEGSEAIGHVLFTRAYLDTNMDLLIYNLAPLAVVPKWQRKGIGKKLVTKGLQILKEKGVELVFVLGHPEYYPKLGFRPAGDYGFSAPYPIAEKNYEAWMVQGLQPIGVADNKGKIICSDILNDPKYWHE